MPPPTATPAFPIAAMRALGSMARNWPIVVPTCVCAAADSRSTAEPRNPAITTRFIPCSSRSLDDRELADARLHRAGIDVEHVQTRGQIQVVLGAQVPRHGTGRRAVVHQGLH